LQAGQVLEGSVGAQERRGFDAVQAQHDGLDQSEDHLGNRIPSVAAGVIQVACQKLPGMQHSHKFMEEVNATKVRETRMITSDSQAPWRSVDSGHNLTER
jgi:hypothetical protein